MGRWRPKTEQKGEGILESRMSFTFVISYLLLKASPSVRFCFILAVCFFSHAFSLLMCDPSVLVYLSLYLPPPPHSLLVCLCPCCFLVCSGVFFVVFWGGDFPSPALLLPVFRFFCISALLTMITFSFITWLPQCLVFGSSCKNITAASFCCQKVSTEAPVAGSSKIDHCH